MKSRLNQTISNVMIDKCIINVFKFIYWNFWPDAIICLSYHNYFSILRFFSRALFLIVCLFLLFKCMIYYYYSEVRDFANSVHLFVFLLNVKIIEYLFCFFFSHFVHHKYYANGLIKRLKANWQLKYFWNTLGRFLGVESMRLGTALLKLTFIFL